MQKMRLFAVLFVSVFLLFGCASQPSGKFPLPPSLPSGGAACKTLADCPPGAASCVNGTCSQYDAHGCVPDGGYQWCSALGKCIRPWETNCTASQQLIGGEKDEHGCYTSAGYVWCSVIAQCVQPWVTPCNASQLTNGLEGSDSALGRNSPPTLVGGDRDSHGCIASAGYSWCPGKNKCLRVWEEACNDTDRLANAQEHCPDANVAQVSVCSPYVKVVSSLMGGGSTFYDDYGNATVCPLVAPDSMSEKCRLLMLGNNCIDQVVDCAKVHVPAAVSDLSDDPSFVGAQLSWSAPDQYAVDYEVFRADAQLKSASLLRTTGQAYYNDVFDGKGATFAYFVRARNAAGAESPVSNIIYVQQLSNSAAGQPSPGQIN